MRVGGLRVVIRPVVRMRPVAQSRARLCPRQFAPYINSRPRPRHSRYVARIRARAHDYSIRQMPPQVNASAAVLHVNTRTQQPRVRCLPLHLCNRSCICRLHQQGQLRGLDQRTRQRPGILAEDDHHPAIRAHRLAYLSGSGIGVGKVNE